jgi:hypothetical protein
MNDPVPDDQVRVGTAERDETAKILNLAFEAGRLTPEELDERLEACFTAKTRGDLAPLTRDLPESSTAGSTAQPSPPTPSPYQPARLPEPRNLPGEPAKRRQPTVRDLWAPWAGVSVLVLTIWFITAVAGGGSYFWPIWVIGPWGAVNLFATIGLLTKPGDDGESS